GRRPEGVCGVRDVLGAGAARVLVVGCEPASLDYGMELSEPVAKAVDAAVGVVMDLIAEADAARSSGEGASDVSRHTRGSDRVPAPAAPPGPARPEPGAPRPHTPP